jgi:glucarate dehydratase
MAMWDARGKSQGVPLATLLGGARRDRIELTEYFSYRWPGASTRANPLRPTSPATAPQCSNATDRPVFEGKMGTVA